METAYPNLLFFRGGGGGGGGELSYLINCLDFLRRSVSGESQSFSHGTLERKGAQQVGDMFSHSVSGTNKSRLFRKMHAAYQV